MNDMRIFLWKFKKIEQIYIIWILTIFILNIIINLYVGNDKYIFISIFNGICVCVIIYYISNYFGLDKMDKNYEHKLIIWNTEF